MSRKNTDFSAKNHGRGGRWSLDFSQKNRFGSNLGVQL
jgi:hypothetical protein